MDLQFGVAAYQRNRGNLPELPVVNMFAESAPTEKTQVALQSRPGLVQNSTAGTADIEAIFQKDGVLSGDLFAVGGGFLYRDGVLVGAIDGSGPVSIAGNEIGLAVTAGETLWFYNGTTLRAVAFPDAADVSKVIELASRFVALRSGTQKFYWSEVLEDALDGTGLLEFGALNFASAESEPDRLLDACTIDDVLVLGGTETVEFWSKTGNNELPFTPVSGRVYSKGLSATGCMVSFDNSMAYVSAEGLVYRAGNVPERISTTGIEERIEASATAALFTFFFEGHEFLNLRLDSYTMAYDAQSKQWCEFASWEMDNWRCRCAAQGPLFGADDGKILEFSGHADLGGVLERRFRAGAALDSGSVSASNIRLRTNPGQTSYLSGTYANPTVEMRTSRDGGQTWGNWRQASLGAQGEYRRQVEWRACGMFDHPGLLAEFRVTDPVSFRVSGVVANEGGGGRSR
jgi:hypothetical protein